MRAALEFKGNVITISFRLQYLILSWLLHSGHIAMLQAQPSRQTVVTHQSYTTHIARGSSASSAAAIPAACRYLHLDGSVPQRTQAVAVHETTVRHTTHIEGSHCEGVFRALQQHLHGLHDRVLHLPCLSHHSGLHLRDDLRCCGLHLARRQGRGGGGEGTG